MRVDTRRRELARQVRQWTIENLHDRMADAGVHRMFIVHENGEFSLSHPAILAPVQAFLELSQDFARHEAIFIGREDGVPTLFFAFIHDTRRGLAQGGLRFKAYANFSELLVDGLRLSRGMTRKNALAGLRWGGGKGILAISKPLETPRILTTPATDEDVTDERRQVFAAYARFIAGIGGVYYTAEDVGTNTPDMNVMLGESRFTTCVHSRMGGSGNPSPFTARGVMRAMQAGWLFLGHGDNLSGVRVAVQGAGNVGGPLVELLDEAGAEVWVSDVDSLRIAELRERHPRVREVATEDVYDLDADIFAPCAIGATVNEETIPRLKVKLICGAANNILKEPADAQRLRDLGIEFVPDYLCNRMGITNCSDEWCGYLRHDIQLAAEKVFPDTLRVLRHARNLAVTSSEAADELADIAAGELHPYLGHRGRRIIDHLSASGWHRGGRREKPVRDLPFEPAVHEPPIRLRWQREGFVGSGPAIAAAPVSGASRPNLATIFSAALMDVQARAGEWLSGAPPRRIAGSDHGGHALQLAVEQSLERERDEVGRRLFEEICRDVHAGNDAAIREQLRHLGVGFDPRSWLDPMQEEGARASRELFEALSEAGLISEEMRLAYHCPHCATVLVASDVRRSTLELTGNYRLRFRTTAGPEIDSHTFYPELVAGMEALAVRPDGAYGELAGRPVVSPIDGRELPTIAVPDLVTDAQIVVPSYSRADHRRAREHGLPQQSSVYDDVGRIRFPDGRRLAPQEARSRVLEAFGERAVHEAGAWEVDIRRCGRCEAIVHPSLSSELYVTFDETVSRVRAMVADGTVQLSHRRWRERLLEHLEGFEPWCISRQLWWGNPIPGRPDEVFSTWFSLAAWSLRGAGWPQDSEPEAAQVFVDSDLLLRWVVPSLLTSVAVSGRPVFSRVSVHGPVQVVERNLQQREGASGKDPDSERFRFRTARKPMRRGRGNTVEPASLIRRFGADALRLGLLLCWRSPSQDAVVVAETQLRRARRVVHRFVAKLDGVFALLKQGHRCGEPRLADSWIVSSAEVAAAEARTAFREERLGDAARLLVKALEDYIAYANVVAERRGEDLDLGALRESTAEFLALAGPAFGPICPFLFDRLDSWMAKRRADDEPGPEARSWLPALVTALRRRGRRALEIGTSERATLGFLNDGADELARLGGGAVAVTETPAAGVARGFGPVVLVSPGSLEVRGDESPAIEWYRNLHSPLERA